MAGAGYKLFNTGDVLTAAQVNTYLQEQVVMVFANAAARTTALSGVLAEGMVTYLKDTDALEIYSGAAWVGYGSGDITGITTGATSGLTGGVTSGTADLKFNTTAKGGLLVGTGSGTVTELAVGTNTHVLTADSTTASGLKWAAASSGTTLVGCAISGSATNTIANATFTAIPCSGELFDTDNFHSTSSNTSRITIPSGKAGKYLITMMGRWDSGALDRQIALYVNGSGIRYYQQQPATQSFSQAFSTIVNANVGDYYEIFVYQGSGGNLNFQANDAVFQFSAIYLGA